MKVHTYVKNIYLIIICSLTLMVGGVDCMLMTYE